MRRRRLEEGRDLELPVVFSFLVFLQPGHPAAGLGLRSDYDAVLAGHEEGREEVSFESQPDPERFSAGG